MPEVRSLPLQNYSVLDLTEVWAGPMGTSMLGDLGATVYRIESYPRLSWTRPLSAIGRGLNFSHGNDLTRPRPWERSARHQLANRNKLGLAINLKEERGKEAFLRLAARCDVAVDGYSSGTLDRLGVGYEALRAVNPRIIYIAISGWGDSGPFAGYIAQGDGIEATTGMAALRGYPGADPTQTSDGYHSDAVSPLMLVLAVNLALVHRGITGEGQRIELSQAESLMTQFPGPFLEYSLSGEEPVQRGNTHPDFWPQGCYRCRGEDAWIVISITGQEQWDRLVAIDGLSGLRSHGPSAAERRRNAAEIDRIIAAWTASWDASDLTEHLQQAGIPAFKVLNDLDLMQDPQLAARGFFCEVEQAAAGRMKLPGPIWRIAGVPHEIRRPSNLLGEHNHEVLTGVLGYSEDEYAELLVAGAIGDSDTLERLEGFGKA